MSNSINSFFERVKDKFTKKAATPPAPVSEPQDAVRKPVSTYSRLQAMSKESNSKMPVVPPAGVGSGPQPGVLNGAPPGSYQASPGGAAATRKPQRASSTFMKLQALSASGTGAADAPKAAQPEEQALHSLLDRLEQ